MNESLTTVFVEQPLALTRSANDFSPEFNQGLTAPTYNNIFSTNWPIGPIRSAGCHVSMNVPISLSLSPCV